MLPALRNAACALLLTFGSGAFAAQPEPPALPELRVETRTPDPTGQTLQVRAGGNFQEALQRARPGDVIELQAGAEFSGPFTLPRKDGDGWIVIRSSRHADLPQPGTRAEPAHAANMAVLTSADSNVLNAAPGAHHYRLVGLEIRPAAEDAVFNLVELGNGQEARNDLPHHIVIDRSYLHGDPQAGTRRGVAMNGAHIAVINSWITDIKEAGADSQALAGWNGTGPFLIGNNHLEAAGENIMFGGSTPAIEGLVPSDIEIRGNHLVKSLTWKADDPSYAGTQWTVKNLFELKNARRVLFDGNVLERNWAQGQNGIAILFTPRNEGGAAPWAVVEDVTFTNNVLLSASGGFNMLGYDDNDKPSGQTQRIAIRNNVFADMGGKWGRAPLFQVLDGVANLDIQRNTALNGYTIVLTEGRPHANVRISNNIFKHNEYGLIGTGTGSGQATLEKYFPEITLERNAIIGGNARNYPGRANFFPMDEAGVGFMDRARGDLRIDLSRHRQDVSDVGADIPALCAQLAPAERTTYCHFLNRTQ